MKNPENKKTELPKPAAGKDLPLPKTKSKFFNSSKEDVPFKKKGFGTPSVIVRQVKH